MNSSRDLLYWRGFRTDCGEGRVVPSGSWLLCVLMLFANVWGCSSRPWGRMTSHRGKFSIAMPCKPRGRVRHRQTRYGRVSKHIFVAQHNGIIYMAGYCDYPAAYIKAQGKSKFLEQVGREAVENILGARLVSQQTITLAKGLSGRAFTLVLPLEKRRAISHVYLVNRRLYQTMILWPQGRHCQQEIKRYLHSFRILR